MKGNKRILLKITGTLLEPQHGALIKNMLENLNVLHATHQFGIVIGGGNFFRGRTQGTALGLRSTAGHTVGMLATLMNGVILKDLMLQMGIKARLVTALPCPTIAQPICQDAIDDACAAGETIIFAGGTGNPFFTTDTNAIMRALQMQAYEVWKATTIDGVYTADPRIDATAKKLTQLTHQDALDRALGIMDLTALTLAKEYKIAIRVFTLFQNDALLEAAQSPHIGSIIETKDTV
jgi:uridylate kinase